MNQSYNVVVNSDVCTPETSGNPNTDKNYYIDWSAVLPQGEYELSFSFISGCNIIHEFLALPIIYADFLSQANIFACQPLYQAISTTQLGLIFPTNLDPNTHHAYLRADKNFNPPIYLANRPYSNQFNIRILNNSYPPFNWFDESTPVGLDIQRYVLILHFKLLKKAV